MWTHGEWSKTGPVEVQASGIYPPQENIWNVLLEMNAIYIHANGVTLYYKMDRPYVRFVGDDGSNTTTVKKSSLHHQIQFSNQ